MPASSLGIIAPTKGPAAVKALVPNSAWDGAGKTGIQVVQLETGGGPTVPAVSIPTTVDVNSCAGNPATGEGVCTANTSAVFVIDSSNNVTTLTSSSDRQTGFSGGSCNNCGVAMNALTNQAVITIGHTTSPSGAALQTLNLATNTFDAPFDVSHEVSENISVDPTRGFVLSADEQSVYDLAQFNSTTGAFTVEFGMNISTPSLELDSSAEDCSTGIALSVGEFSNFVVLSDLTQAVLNTGDAWHVDRPNSRNEHHRLLLCRSFGLHRSPGDQPSGDSYRRVRWQLVLRAEASIHVRLGHARDLGLRLCPVPDWFFGRLRPPHPERLHQPQ